MDYQEIVNPTDKNQLVKIFSFILPLQIILLLVSVLLGVKYTMGIIVASFLLMVPFINLELSLSIVLILFIFINRPWSSAFAYKNILIQDIFFVIILAGWFFRRSLNNQLEEFPKSGLIKSYIFFLLVGSLAALVGLFNHNKLYEIIYESREIIYLFTFFIIIDIVRNMKQIYFILGSFLLATDLFAIESIIGSVTKSRTLLFGVAGLRYVEPTSVFLALGLILCVTLLFMGKINRYLRIPLFGSMLLMVIALLLSLTRGYWLGAAAGLVFIFFFLPSKRKLNVLLVAVVLLIVGVIGSATFLGFSPKFIFNLVSSRAASLKFVSFDPSAMARIVEVEAIIKEIPKSLILGKGLGAALYIYKFDRSMWMEWSYFHNNYFEILLKMGMLGIGAYFAVVFNFFKSGFMSLRLSSPATRSVIVSILGMYVCLMVTSLTSGVILFLDTAPLIGIMMGIVLVAQKGLIKENTTQGTGQP